MLGRRLQILADGQEIDICGAHVIHHLQDARTGFAKPHHDPRLGEHRRVQLFDLLQQAQRVEIARTGAHFEIKARHGFKIVVEHIRARLDHLFQSTRRAFQEIGR